jgi:Fe/S biogenesis protein NfuA
MKTEQEIQTMLDEQVNSLLKSHGGSVIIVGIDDSVPDARIAWIEMKGGCQGCSGAKYTINMLVSNKIKEFDSTIVEILDTTDHSDKTKAYYKE